MDEDTDQLIQYATDAFKQIKEEHGLESQYGDDIDERARSVALYWEDDIEYSISAWDNDESEGIQVVGAAWTDYDVGLERDIRASMQLEQQEVYSEEQLTEVVRSLHSELAETEEADLADRNLSWSG